MVKRQLFKLKHFGIIQEVSGVHIICYGFIGGIRISLSPITVQISIRLSIADYISGSIAFSLNDIFPVQIHILSYKNPLRVLLFQFCQCILIGFRKCIYIRIGAGKRTNHHSHVGRHIFCFPFKEGFIGIS